MRVRALVAAGRRARPLAPRGALLAGLALALASCADPAPITAPRGSETLGTLDPVVAATVNGKPIYVTDVLVEAARRGMIEPGQDLEPTSDNFYQVLQDLIELKLLSIEAEARNLDENPDARHRLDQARTVVLAAILDEHLRSTLVSEQQLRRFYEENARLLSDGELVHVRHILLAGEDMARAAKARLDRNEPFETVAFEMSLDRVSGGEGGDLGFRQPESLPEGLEPHVRNAAVEAIVGPVQSEAGWHVLQVKERRRREPPSFEAMRPRLEQELYWSELRQLVERLRGDARIELFLEERDPGFAPAENAPAPADAEEAPPERRLRGLGEAAGDVAEGGLPPPPADAAEGGVIPRAPRPESAEGG